jgi:hypothetical protein
MAVPALPHLLAEHSIESLLRSNGLPKATCITPAKVTAQYHAIYFITVPASEASRGHRELVLRVSSKQCLPGIKTRNEVGVMSWIATHTTIPIPALIAYDSSEENAIGHEYSLLSRIPGVTLSDVYDKLDELRIRGVLDQVIDILLQLHRHPFDQIGGLALNDGGEPSPARVVDETFWTAVDAERYWPPGETVNSLNIGGPYRTYVDYISAQMQQYSRLILLHDELDFMRDILPRIDAFVTALYQHADKLNRVKLRLAHKDLHMANIMCDPISGNITGILDWEFSGIVPFTKWDPRRALLWNGRTDDESAAEKQRLLRLFNERCVERKVKLLEDVNFVSPWQESMQTVADYLRAIVEVSPRGQRQDLVPSWKEKVVQNLEVFGV